MSVILFNKPKIISSTNHFQNTRHDRNDKNDTSKISISQTQNTQEHLKPKHPVPHTRGHMKA
jgi:hypothetical protein